jgi:serine/threonine-protein kinase
MLKREGRFTAERTGRLLVQLCDVLQEAHQQGIVHRDIKPGNMMILYPGTPHETLKLMDYGLAKMTKMLYISPDELFDFNLPPASGTPEYISPEMVRGTEMDGRGDLYSVGVVLFEMLTGRRPFLYSSIERLMRAHANEPPPSFADAGLVEGIPAGLEAVVMSCMEKYPHHRPASASDLARAYEKALGRRLIQTRTTTSSSPGEKAAPIPTRSAPPAVDRNAFRHSIEAFMPEAMAMIKLKGFVYDLGGEVVESVPGMIKVRLIDGRAERKRESLMGWTSGVSRPAAVVAQQGQVSDIELHMERRDPVQTSNLTITLVMRPTGGLATVEWRNRCNQVSRDLQAYLMGR